MNVTCPSCSADIDVDSSRVPASGLSMRCPQCSHTFRVDPNHGEDDAPTLADGGDRTDNPRYFVKRPTGKVFGPFDANALTMMLEAGKLSGQAQVSTDKQEWQHISRVPALADHVEASDDPAESAPVGSTRLGGWASSVAEDDEVDKTEVRPPQLPAPGGDDSDAPSPSLPRPKKTGGDDGGAALPASKKSPDLPKPSLPRPKSKKTSSSDAPLPAATPASEQPSDSAKNDGDEGALPTSKESADLPGLTSSDAQLPASKGGDNLPRSTGSDDLPRSAGSQDLPRSASSQDLPRSAGSQDLPRPKGPDSLPEAKGSDSLPEAKGSDSLPEAKGSDSLPEAKGDDALPTSQADEADIRAALQAGDEPDDEPFGVDDDEEDLFAAPIDEDDDDLFADPDEDDDLFGEEDDDLFDEGDDDLFAAPIDEESDPFAEPAGQDSDPFAEPAGQDSDPFAEPAGQDSDPFAAPDDGLQEDSDDLFAAPIDEDEGDDDLFEAGGLDDDDLFDDDSDDDDFLSGNDSFTFLDDEDDPQEDVADDFAQDDPAGESGRWGEDLMGNAPPEAAGDSADFGSTTSASPAPESPAKGDPFRPASPGPRQPASQGPTAGAASGTSAQTTREQAVEEDKKRGLMTMIGVPLIAILVLGGAGYGLYSTFLAGSGSSSESEGGQQDSKPVSIDLQTATTDNYGDLQSTVDSAEGGKLADDQAPRLLLVQSLFLTRYEDDEVAKRADELAAKYEDADGGWEALARGAYEAQKGNSDAARSFLEPLVDAEGERAYFAHLLMGIGDVLALEDHLEASRDESQSEESDDSAKGDDEDKEDEANKGDDGDDEARAEGDDSDDDQKEDDDKDKESADKDQQDDDHDESDDKVAEFDATARQLADRATTELERAARADKEAPAPHYWRGRLLALSDDDEGALEALGEALEASENHVASRVLLGQLHHERGELNDAVEHLSKVHKDYRGQASGTEKASAFHLVGRVHTARQETEGAINAYTDALNIAPDRSDTLRALAEEYMAAEEYEDALNFFTSNENLGAEDPEVMIGMVRAHMGLEEWDEAITKLEEGEEEFPDDARFPYYLGKLNRERGSFHDAMKAYERALEIDDDLLSARAALARLVYRLEEDQSKAEEHVAKIAEKPDNITADVAEQVAQYYENAEQLDVAEQWYQAALEKDPNHWSSRLSLARMFLDHGETERALELLERARDEGIDDTRLSAYLADAYRQSGEHSRAIDQINDVIDKRPKDPEYIFIRGRIYFDQGNYGTARRDFNQAYEIDPEFHEAYFYVGRTSFEDEDYQGATKIFRHVLDYKPNTGKYHYWMGRTYEAQGRPDQALDAYDKATSVDDDYGEQHPMIYVRRGRLLGKRGHSDRGKRDVARALEIDPDMTEALVAAGDSLYGDKKYEEAIENYSKAIDKDPEQAEVRYRLGMSLLHTDREVEGAEHLQEAVRYGYDDPDVFKRLGYLYKEMNKNKLAVESFKEYLKRVGEEDSVPASTKREMLDQIEQLGGSL